MRKLVVVLGIAACGDDGGTNAGSSSGAGTATSGPSATTDADSTGASPTQTSTGDGSGTESSDTGGTGDPLAGQWHTLTSVPSGPRQETAVAAAGGRVYLIGGLVGSGSAVEAYDPAVDAWEAAPDLPVAMHHANTSAVDDTIFVTGFLTGAGFAADTRVFALAPGAADWDERTGMPVGTERGASAVAVVGTDIYIFGGLRGGQSIADAWVYDTVSDTWDVIPDLPAARDHVVAGAVDGRVIVAGGRDGGALTDRVDIYDPATDSWSAGAPMPTARAGTMGAVMAGHFFVFGGEGNPADPDGVFEDNEAYDPSADAWNVLTPMITPRHGTGAATVGDRIYVPGGATLQGLGAVDTHEAWG